MAKKPRKLVVRIARRDQAIGAAKQVKKTKQTPKTVPTKAPANATVAQKMATPAKMAPSVGGKSFPRSVEDSPRWGWKMARLCPLAPRLALL
uniref:Uncharacterized protein n=1 Tax=Leptobrachium leishanense TaxID=445787 RepID=A0A8C5LSM5_9ANUR